MNRAQLQNAAKLLILSILAWGCSLGLFVLVRRVGAGQSEGWNPSNITILGLWIAASVLFGATYWVITVVSETRMFRTWPFGALILAKSIAMLAALACYLVVRGALAIVAGDMTVIQAWNDGSSIALQPITGVFLLCVCVISLSFSFVRQMSAMVGQRVLINIVMGKYRRPKTESRIFMFLDLEGSTAIAETLGHEKFCELIQECFRDLTDSAIRRNVEVYQYVGDEAILTWSPARGSSGCNCLHVFFEFQQTLDDRAEFYLKKFGVNPQFKAGANYGPATVAEVGVVKRDIAYLSDVLNTAARLESMCRVHGARLLITKHLKDLLPESPHLDCQPVGELDIRGKRNRVGVYRVEARQN